MTNFIKQPPYDIEAETSVIASMLLNNKVISRVKPLLPSEVYFYHPNLAVVYSAMLDLIKQNRPVDIVTVTSELQNKGKLETVGGKKFITDLALYVTSAANVEYWVKIVKEKHQLREYITKSEKNLELAYNGEDINSLLNSSRKDIVSLMSDCIKSGTEHCNSALDAYMSEAELIRPHDPKENVILGISFGYDMIDKYTYGCRKGDLILLAGASSGGKTAFSLNIADNIARAQQKPVLFFSLEMLKSRLMSRIVSFTSGVPKRKVVLTNKASEQEWDRIKQAVDDYRKNPLWINDKRGLTIDDIVNESEYYTAKHGSPALIVIDHMTLIRPDSKSKYSGKTYELGDMSAMLRSMAADLDTSVILLSQLNRDIEKREDKTPNRGDIFGSDQIFHNADLVMVISDKYKQEIDMEEKTAKATKVQGKKDIYLLKVREGCQEVVPVDWTPELTKISNEVNAEKGELNHMD